MTLNENMRRLIEQVETAERQYREKQEAWLAKLDFDWRKAPQLDHGEIGGNPLNAPESLEIELRDGRLINLEALYQYYVYRGTLCGVPPTPEDDLIEALKTAQLVFPEFGRRSVMLQPVFHGGTFKRSPGQEPYPYSLVWLPKVCTIAQFRSDAPARDRSEVYSSLVVIWFQDRYGLPDDTGTLDQLRHLDWDARASDWTP